MPPRKAAAAPRASKATAPTKKKAAASPKKKTPVKRAGTMAETAAEGQKFLKKQEAKAKAKAPTNKEMAIEAITALKSGRKGVSHQAIGKYVRETYGVEPNHHLKLALKNGVENGIFEKVTAGSYKLGPEAKKKPAPKKKKAATTTTKKATTTTKKAGTTTKKAGTTTKKATTTTKKAGTTTTKKAAAGSKGKKASSTKKAAGSKGKKAGSKK